MKPEKHIHELQTLRGIAALIVAISHISSIYGQPYVVRVAIDSILNAHASIVVFFVLSGYVLTGSLVRRGLNLHAVTNFYISRAFRLFPAIWVISGLSAFFLVIVPSMAQGPALDIWLRPYLRTFPSLGEIALSLITVNNTLIMPIWTVGIELIGSAFMPLFVVVASLRPRLLPWFVFFLGIVAYLLANAPHRLNALSFMFEFGLGVLIATNRHWFLFQAPVSTMLVASVVLVFFRSAWFAALYGSFMPLTVGYEEPIPMIIEALAGSILIAVLTAGHGNSLFLNNPFSVWLGDISYSLYLVHFPVAILIAKLLSRIFSPSTSTVFAMLILLSTSLCISFILSHLTFKFVERPANQFGKSLSYKISQCMRVAQRH